HVDMGGRIPFSPGVGAVGIAKRNVNSGILFVLQNLADHVFQIDVGSDSKLAHAVAVFVGVRVLPEVVFQFAILGVSLGKPVLLHVDGQRGLLQVAKFRAQI